MSHVSPFLGNIFGDTLEIKHFHLYCGLGGFAAGVNQSNPRLGNLEARYRCLGGIDVDPAGIKDFEKLTGTKGTVLDMFSRDQYTAFHGKEPPVGWREATPDDIRRAAGNEAPDVVFLSAPCKGFSGLLAEDKSKSAKYQALNQLALRGLFLTLEAFKDDLPALWGFENVPRIQSRGRHLLDQITAMFRHYGYLVAETTHDCGEIGNLGQSRKRFLMVARLAEKVPNFLYEPEKHPLRSVGEVIGRFPFPGDVVRAGPMHRIPALQWKTWVRLAFVPAGKDWRALNKLRVEDGFLKDFGLVPESAFERGPYGVNAWDHHADSVRGRSLPTNGRSAVADPRAKLDERYPVYGVLRMDQTVGVISGKAACGSGAYSVADPRCKDGRHNNVFRVVRMDEPSPSVTGGTGPSAGGLAVADPSLQGPLHAKYGVAPFGAPSRTVIAGSTTGDGAFAVADPRPGVHPTYKQVKYRICNYDEPSGTVAGASTSGMSAFAVADPNMKDSPNRHYNQFRCIDWDGHSKTIIGATRPGSGAMSVADPRPNIQREKGDAYLHSRLFGIVPWTQPSFVVSGKAKHDNGPNNVADPRLPGASDKLVCYIRAEDGTWHRPFTTLELAALQSLVEPEEHLELEGLSDSAWRERIGNAVPKKTAKAIGFEFGRCLLGAHKGETFRLSATPIWVRNVAIALSVAMPEVVQ